jgi:hypothetical protein
MSIREVGSVLNHANAGRENEGVRVPLLDARDGATQGNRERRKNIDSSLPDNNAALPLAASISSLYEQERDRKLVTAFHQLWHSLESGGVYERKIDRDKIDIDSVSRSQCRFCTNFARDLEPASH